MGAKSALLSRIASHEQGLVRALGMRLVSLGAERVRGRMPWSVRASQMHGVLHGGALAALADTVAGLGTVHLAGAGWRVVTAEMKVNFFGNILRGCVDADARLLHRGSRSMVWEVRLTSPGRRGLLGFASVTCVMAPPDE